MLRFQGSIVPPPPRGYLRWEDVPDAKRGALYEWEGRRAVIERRERENRKCGHRAGLLIGLAIGTTAGVLVGMIIGVVLGVLS